MGLAGVALDTVEPRAVLAMGLLLNGTGIFLLSQPLGMALTPATAVVFGVVHGLGNGASSCTFKAAPAIFFGRDHLGEISGVLAALNLLSTAVGPLLIGASFDALGSYSLCLRWLAATTAGFALVSPLMTAPTKGTASTKGTTLTNESATHTQHSSTQPNNSGHTTSTERLAAVAEDEHALNGVGRTQAVKACVKGCGGKHGPLATKRPRAYAKLGADKFNT